MGTMILQSQLGALESGLKDLRKSRLMHIREFKDMYGAIESHHRDLRLAHLTGKAKDLMVQAEQDTRFYHILIKMMCEVKQTSSGKQKESLIKVHHWYTSNKHILHSGPRFGRQRTDSPTSKPQSARVKTASTKRTKSAKTNIQSTKPETPTVRLASADGSKNRIFCETPSLRTETPYRTGFDLDFLPSNQDYVNDYLTSNLYGDGDSKMMSLQHFLNDLPGASSRLSDYQSHGHNFEIKKSPGSLDDSGGTPPGSIGEDIDGSAVSPNYIDSLINSSHKIEDHTDDEEEDIDVTIPTGAEDSDMHERKLSRGRTPSASLGKAQTLSDQSSNISIALPKKMIHPIASLVNPHATLAAAEARRAEEEYLLQSRQDMYTPLRIMPSRQQSAPLRTQMTTPVSVRPLSNTRAESLNQWKNFNRDQSYGQDILGKLNFVGRSGTALDVRYSSHSQGECPEEETPYLLAYYSKPMVLQSPVNTENRLMNRSLEEFYQLAEDYYPPKLPKYHHPVVNKPTKQTPPKSAPPNSARSEVSIHPLGRNLLESRESKKSDIREERCTSEVKLDLVVNMIDSVSEDMTYYKERLAPPPVAGFRQPSSTGVSMKPLSRPATASGVRSPVMRTNTPVGNLSRSLSNPYISQDILIQTEEKQVSSQPQAIDWRGKIAPDSVRHKWQKNQFGGHTFVKKMVKGKRPVGATHAGCRPKTAPVSTREKWKTEKPSDANTRVEGQAATNTMTQVDQKSVDSMMVINHILGSSDSRAGSFNSLYFDENFLKSINARTTSAGGTTNTNTPVPLEYVPIVTNAPKSLPESRATSRITRRTDKQEFLPEDEEELNYEQTEESYSHTGVVTTTPIQDRVQEDIGLNASEEQTELNHQSESAINEGQSGQPETVNTEGQSEDQTEKINRLEPVHFSEDLHNGDVHLEVLAIPSGGRVPTPPNNKHATIQDLTTSDSWNFSLDGEIVKEGKNIRRNPLLFHRSDHWFKAILKPENYCFECIPESMSTKVGRQAGRMPNRTQSASAQVLRMSRKQPEYFKLTPPMRTPPSIPSASHKHTPISDQSPRYGQMYNGELDHHALSTRSPRHFMEQVVDLRTNGVRSAPPGSHSDLDGPLSSSLLVSGLKTRENTQIGSSRPSGIEHEKTMYGDNTHIETRPDGSKHVIFEDQTELPVGDTQGDVPGMEERSKSNLTLRSKKSNQSLAHVGRPIAHYHNVKDPDETAAASKLQKEAVAAVDIQRIFRGYVARNVYKKLIKEVREKGEDERKAAIEIQRRYRGHLIRKTRILNRPPVSKESLEWARELKVIQAEKAERRQNKMEALNNLNTMNQQASASKLSTIGPHVEIYQIYHPKVTGPTKREMYDAATSIQKHIRGFLVRCRFDRLYRKAVWYGSTWQKMVKDYKNSLKRCQQRHGVDRPKTPFTIEFMNDYMESRRRYESVFDKKAFAGELEFGELDQFFRECDLYPSQSEIEEAIDVVFQGQASSKKGLQKSDVLELVWYIYVPKAAGLPSTRQSTWLNPIIDGVEARKLIGSEYVEKAPLEVCAKLVIDSKRERRQQEEREKTERQDKEAAQRKKDLRDYKDDDDSDEERKSKVERTRELLKSISSDS